MKQQDTKQKKDGEEHTVAICGGGGVGKSSITVQFVKHFFDEDYDPTIEDSYTQRLMVDKQVCNLNIVDTAGQDEYKSLRSSYMRSCEGFVLVFDMTDKRSLEGLQEYVGDIRRAKDSDHFPVVLCGNKSDLVDLHAEKIIEHADSFRRQFLNNCPFFETSAKERVNIDETFSELVRRVRQVKQKNAPATQPTSQKKGLFSSLSESQDSKKDLDQFKNL